jgi:hypothetical protein
MRGAGPPFLKLLESRRWWVWRGPSARYAYPCLPPPPPGRNSPSAALQNTGQGFTFTLLIWVNELDRVS